MKSTSNLQVALVVPHIFMHRDILPNVIFSPGTLAVALAEGLSTQNIDVTLCTPGPVDTSLNNITADLSYFEAELAGRNDSYVDLLRKHPFVFTTLARQVQSELIAKVFALANEGQFDVVHIYTNEEDIALPFAKLCNKPVVFTHHDPFNFSVKYKNNFPKYTNLNWLSISMSQRATMPPSTNWVSNIYHGLDPDLYHVAEKPKSDYIAFLGRIIEPKGVHLAIQAVRQHNQTATHPIKLKIAGKHYSDGEKDTYWKNKVEPELDNMIEYVGFIKDTASKNDFLANAKALIIPSTFDEPFGMVMIESLASGTPIIGLNSGAIPEIITEKTGVLVEKGDTEVTTIDRLASAINQIDSIDRADCRHDFESRFTLEIMCQGHAQAYQKLA
jgi:glycosyltransferase involved in cell wall biosynthesis